MSGWSDGADETGGRITGQLRVGVERDDVFHAAEPVQIADLHREGVESAAQELIEVEQFAALALPPHPAAFRLVVHAVPMKQEEGRSSVRTVTRIQPFDQFHTQDHERIVLVLRTVGIGRIGEQREIQVGIAISQEADFEIEREIPHLRFIQKQRRYRDHGGAVLGNPFQEVQLRQHAGRRHKCRQVIHEIRGGLRGGQYEEQ